MTYNYNAAAKHIQSLREKVRQQKQKDGTWQDLGLSKDDSTPEKEKLPLKRDLERINS